MESINNLHKQKLYVLVAAAIAFIALFLPWITVNFIGFSSSANGIRGWGILSFLGTIGAIGLTLLSNRTEEFTPDLRRNVAICFAAISLGALLFLLRKNTMGANAFTADLVNTGIGLWICLIAGLGGLAILFGRTRVSHDKPL